MTPDELGAVHITYNGDVEKTLCRYRFIILKGILNRIRNGSLMHKDYTARRPLWTHQCANYVTSGASLRYVFS